MPRTPAARQRERRRRTWVGPHRAATLPGLWKTEAREGGAPCGLRWGARAWDGPTSPPGDGTGHRTAGMWVRPPSHGFPPWPASLNPFGVDGGRHGQRRRRRPGEGCGVRLPEPTVFTRALAIHYPFGVDARHRRQRRTAGEPYVGRPRWGNRGAPCGLGRPQARRRVYHCFGSRREVGGLRLR